MLKWLCGKTANALLPVAALACIAPPAAADQVTICYNYGCYARAQVEFSDAHLAELEQLLARAGDAASERKAISAVIGRMYAIAGEQTPIWRDRGGNYADSGQDGQMDCIDHSNNTYVFLSLLDLHGWLRFHEVLDPVLRMRFIVATHWAARIRDRKDSRVYAVDSWYVDNGRAAPVVPIEDWHRGRVPEGGA